jgi:ADP-ribose pyrophosphatase
MNIKDRLSLFQPFNGDDVEVLQVTNRYQGFFKIDEYHLRHRLFEGGYSKVLTREIFDRGDAVVIMPYDAVNDRIIFTCQFRPGALARTQTPWLIEFVAGMFNDNENPIEVAIREAKEEANLTITTENITPIMQYLSSPGGTNEYIHLYLGLVDSTGIEGVYGLPEEGEDIIVTSFSRSEAMALLAQGKINNASTVIGLQWLELNYVNYLK